MGSGPLEWAGDVVAGGWNAIGNITAGLGKGAEALISPFFPSPQKSGPTVSETVAAAGGAGDTFRRTAVENQSMVETNQWRDFNWVTSPYAANFAPTTKVEQSRRMDAMVSVQQTPFKPVETIFDVIGAGVGTATKVRTVVDEFMEIWGLKPREPISEGPKEVGNSRGDVSNVGKQVSRAAETVSAWGSAIVKQVKGLFSLGFSGPEGGQPAFGIKHEIEPSTKLTIYGAIALAVIAIILLRKK